LKRDFNIEARRTDDVLILDLHGELDLATAPSVRDAVAHSADGQAAILVDLQGLEFIDSTGVRLLLELNAQPVDPPIAFANPSETVARLLALTGLRDMLRWRDGPDLEAPA
jgi:anti-sigma B factor antagonist